MDFTVLDHVLAALAAAAAGMVNAVAGGGTMITFPTLMALGLPALSANMTNTVALSPGYFGATHAQRHDIAHQRSRVPAMVVASGSGAVLGSLLLLTTSERLFRSIVPFMLLMACALLLFGDRIKAMLPAPPAAADIDAMPQGPPPLGVIASVFAIGIYAGYFGAGIGIISLAVMSLAMHDSMVRINALKQLVAFTSNIIAAAFFVFSGKVEFSLVLVMAPAALLGGNTGGRLVRHMKPALLRTVIVTIGVLVALNFWL